MKRTKKIVLDTSIFVNPDSRHFFGESPKKAFSNFLDQAKNKKNVKFYMPPSIFEELMKFIEGGISTKQAIAINKKPPSSYKTPIPALLLYEFIEEMRNRMNKGLRIAEKYIRKAKESSSEEKELIKSIRDEYRMNVREGVLDSKQDFDLILLAQEKKATIATSDMGLVKWAQKLGIGHTCAEELKHIIE